MSRVSGPNQTSGSVSGPTRKGSEYPAGFAYPAFLNAFDTSPRCIWASQGEYLADDTGATTTKQYFSTRVKARIAGGRWLALAPVYFGGKQYATRSPVGNSTPKCTIAFALELANGTLSPADYTCPNTGGSVQTGTFGGTTDGILRPGDLLVGDFIYASAFGLDYFEWTDRALWPWIRTAYSKGSATDSLGVVTISEYNYPWNNQYAEASSYSAAKTLIATSGISSYNSGVDHWGSGDTSLPSCLGFIGIPMDGQKAMVFFGTSILDGDGAVSKQWGGVNPANNSPANYDQLGFPSAYAQSLTTQVAVLNFGVGASAAMNLWAMSGTSPDWITNTEDVALQKATISKLLKWFDITTVYDPNNDTESTLIGCYYNFSSTARASNPKIKVYGIKVPNGGVKEDGTTTAYSSGGLDAKYADMDTALSNGWIHGIWDLQEGTKVFPDLGTQYSGTTTSSGSMTTLNDSGATWQRNQWTNSFVNIGGTKKLISSNTRTQLTFATFASSVLSGTAYSIEGNTSGDQLHPNTVGQAYLGALLKQRIDATESIPYFTRTQ